MITLETTSAEPWARNSLAEVSLALRKRAADARTRGGKHLPMRQAANYLADAYEEAAIVIERKLAGINPTKGAS